MDRLPLLFLFKNTIQGHGFQADVTVKGRALVERGAEEEGEVWVTSVQPGGIAEGAQNEEEAYKKFKALFLDVLYDVADEAENFEKFRLGVQDFFKGVCHTTEKMWWEAVQAVRREEYTEEGLTKKPAETPVDVIIECVKQPCLEYQNVAEEAEQETALAA